MIVVAYVVYPSGSVVPVLTLGIIRVSGMRGPPWRRPGLVPIGLGQVLAGARPKKSGLPAKGTLEWQILRVLSSWVLTTCSPQWGGGGGGGRLADVCRVCGEMPHK